MAAPTSISAYVDRLEYSRYEIEDNKSKIIVTVNVSGGGDMSGEELTVYLMKGRRARQFYAHSQVVTVVGISDPNTVTLTLDLNLLYGTDFISTVRRGTYFIRVESVSDPDVFGVSSDFYLSVITADFVRNSDLFGLTLSSFETRDLKYPPQEITGITVVEVSAYHPVGFEPLIYHYDSVNNVRQLAWGQGGPLVSITRPGQYLLPKKCSTDYIAVQVSSLVNLPLSSKTDILMVQKATLSDVRLRRWISQACDWLENDKLAGLFLEPTRLVTSPVDPSGVEIDWDVIVPSITFYPPNPGSWLDISFPYPSLLKISQLYGQMARTRVITVSTDWISIKERSGFVQLVPFSQLAGFQYLGLMWVESMRGRIELPNFWRFDAIAGLREVSPVLLEVLSKKAAIDALTVAGQAFRGGFAAQAISRDGVSESVNYTSSAVYGIYSATIEEYHKFINREIKQLKGRFLGLRLTVV